MCIKRAAVNVTHFDVVSWPLPDVLADRLLRLVQRTIPARRPVRATDGECNLEQKDLLVLYTRGRIKCGTSDIGPYCTVYGANWR